MATIGIIGANGQVGMEVCLFLKVLGQDRVLAISRTELGSFLLRRLGIECRHGSVGASDEAKFLVSECDVVADFSLPKGLASAQRAALQQNISNAVLHAEDKSKYIFISTTMVFGVDKASGAYTHDWIPRTVYAASKRYGERLAMSLGRQANREVYVLRLGNVHGLIQSISNHMKASVRYQPTYVPRESSDAVFAFTLAEALSNIARDRESPGIYTAVSAPAWSWKDLFAYYAADVGLNPPVIEVDSAPDKGVARCILESLRGKIGAFVNRNRECLTGNILTWFPQWEMRIKLRRLATNTANEIRAFENRSKYCPVRRIGPVPGTRLRSLSDSRETMRPSRESAKLLLRNAGVKTEL